MRPSQSLPLSHAQMACIRLAEPQLRNDARFARDTRLRADRIAKAQAKRDRKAAERRRLAVQIARRSRSQNRQRSR